MSKSTGGPSQIISLPKGGGALKGIGETFSPDLFTGTGHINVPISLPPGRNGTQPQLNLSYSTAGGNSPFGLGWGMGVPEISRQTGGGLPRYQAGRAPSDRNPSESSDTFILSGTEGLVPVARPSPGVTLYRPRTESLFARIEHHTGDGQDFWKVRGKEGLVSTYGSERPPDAGSEWRDPAVLADPRDPRKIFAWKLTRTEDPFGNRIAYDYLHDRVDDGRRAWNQLYLERVRYADFRDEEGAERFLVSVTLEYGERPDPFSVYRAGFEIRTRLRCERLVIRTHAEEDRPVRSMGFHYESAGHNRVSLLTQVELIGGGEVERMPPLSFGYTRFEPEGRRFVPIQGRELPERSLANADLELADLFGRGLPDIVQMNGGGVRYWRNLGAGRFDLPRAMRDAPAGVDLADPAVRLVDADGDGRVDLAVYTEPLPGYFPLTLEGEWDRRSFQVQRVAPSFSLTDPEVHLVDLDGDGVTDAIRSGARFELFFQDPVEGWNESINLERRAADDFPDVSFSDPRVRWADMSGDGLQDVVLIFDGNIEYWPNLGYGRFAPKVPMRNSPRLPVGYDPRRLLLGDIDGDGLNDLVYVDHGQVLAWINQGGDAWSDPVTIDGTPPVNDLAAVRLADVMGTGVAGILWSYDADGLTRERMFYLDVASPAKPYLLAEMATNTGAVTRIEYASSTRFYLADEARRSTRWKTPLPFPVQVVARTETIDLLSAGKLVTTYRYHHGCWDGGESEFRGFALVEQLDTQTFDQYHAAGLHDSAEAFAQVEAEQFSPPTLTKTWFHVGPVGEEHGDWDELDWSAEYWPDDPPMLDHVSGVNAFLRALPDRPSRRDALRALRGAVLRQEIYALDGSEAENRPYTVTDQAYGIREEEPPADQETSRERIFFTHTLAQRVTQWERGDDPMTRFEFKQDYDAFGQPRDQIAIACPRGWRRTEHRLPLETPFLATYIRTDYADSDGRGENGGGVYCKDRVARSTSFHLKHLREMNVFDLQAAVADPAAREVIGQTLTYYDGEAFVGLPFGRIGRFGAPVRSEQLVFTEAILQEAYRGGGEGSGDNIPPYLVPGGPVAWTAEYPESFRNGLTELAGYVFHDGSGPEVRGYFAPSKRTRFDFHDRADGRGLAIAIADDAGGATSIEFDAFSLLPERVTDALGLVTTSRYDYRVLQPAETIDPNGNRIRYTYTDLGSLASIAIMGKEGEEAGDTPETPGMRFEYDFLAFVRSPPGARKPISVRTVQREHHAHPSGDEAPPEERDDAIIRVEYSDGFGRLIQRRIQAEDVRFGSDAFGTDLIPADPVIEPGSSIGRLSNPDDPPNVLVTGVQVFDNKGQVVEQFEPFYSTGFDYAAPGPTQRGSGSRIFYDPRGHVVRTVHPNGSVKRVILGIPKSLKTPEDFIPTPWESYTYDQNDNAATFEGEHHVDPSHFHTPASIEVDALGRAIKSTAHPGAGDPIVIVTEYDIRGNVRAVIDPLGRIAFRYVYDLSTASHGARVLREESLDRGLRRIVFDASGREVERRDGKGALILQAYDQANRPVLLWARDGEGLAVMLRQRLVYGDAAGLARPEDDNLRGKLFRHFDEAGLIEMSSYDFKGNLLWQVRRAIRDEELLAAMDASDRYQVDWEAPGSEGILEERPFQTDMAYDAMNRLRRVHYPVDADGDRKTLVPGYGRSGLLERLSLLSAGGTEERVFVHHIAYDARGQRSLIAYGNGQMTRYAYEPDTFLLARVRTERFIRPDPLTFAPVGGVLQDVSHLYDLNGNLLRIRDQSPGCGIPGTLDGLNALERVFTFDPLNRLVAATGREHATRAPSTAPWLDAFAPTSQDPTQTRAYREEYDYDVAGNLQEVRHRTPDSSRNFTRRFLISGADNRLDSYRQGESTFDCDYDGAGNLLGHALSHRFVWNHSDRLAGFRIQAGGGPPSLEALYLYDALGQRVKKVVRRANGAIESATWIGNSFEHYSSRGGSGQPARTQSLVHIMDNQRRIAIVRIGEPFADDSFPAVRFELADHLGSSVITLNETGSELRREEYYPYGDTSFGGFARKRYRFTGRERDEENGLTYHRHRYYAPWLMRWISPDPAGRADGLNLYRYARNQPMGFVDPEGTSAWSWTQSVFSTIWSYTKDFARFNWSGDFTVGGYQVETMFGRNPYDWSREAKDIAWNHTKRGWGKVKQVAGNLWGWSKSHTKLAVGLGIGAAALLGTLGYFKGKWIMNWIVAPAIRVGTNAAFGMALWGTAGAWLGAATGLVHGLQMARAGTYKKPLSWLAFAFDNTWSLFNSFLGSIFAMANTIGGNEVNKASSADMGGLYFKEPWIGESATTIGNVTVGEAVPSHERVHAWQARILGPAYVPAVLTGYVFATVIPYWIFTKDCAFNAVGDYFTKGVYPNTWHEAIAFWDEGDRCGCC
jgi:RHS repeat-associated protein